MLATWFAENPASQDGNVAGNLDEGAIAVEGDDVEGACHYRIFSL